MATDVVYAREGYNGMLLGSIEGLALWAHLYTAGPELSADMVRGDFTLASFPGSAPLPIWRWTPPMLRGGRSFSVCDPLVWRYDGLVTPPPILGYIATHGQDGPVAWAWQGPVDGFVFVTDGRVLTIYVRLTFPPPPPV